MARFGVKRAHINLISELAIDYYQQHGITVSYEKRIERLQCKTEELLGEMNDQEQMYRLLRKRAKLVRGGYLYVYRISLSPTLTALLS